MKSAILAIACAAALFSGCSSRDQYSTEKAYWRLSRQLDRISKNSSAVPEYEVESVIRQFDVFIKAHKDSPLAVESQFLIARVYIGRGELEKARGHLQKVFDAYSLTEVKAESLFLTGTTYEDTDWDKARSYYARVVSEYPRTRRGLGTPLYIAECYRKRFEPEKMLAAYDEAVRRYLSFADSYPGTSLAFESCLLASSCYGGLKDWRSSVKMLERVLVEFKDRVAMDSILMNIALIYRNQLKDTGRMKEALARLVQEYPRSPLANTARFLMAQNK
ncbi:MAG: tetratricopeptide repeat protein [Deltaproteobacteria bacterium]